MITILFWNVGATSRREQIADLAVNYDVDVVLLAEVADTPFELLQSLNRISTSYSYVKPLGNNRFSIFVRFPEEFIGTLREDNRWTIRRLNPPGLDELLLAVVHLPSKKDWSEGSQSQECNRLAEDIRGAEENAGHRSTVLVGDFNMNPFENGMISARELHAVMDRRIARGGNRTVQGQIYPFFYNPMWSRFGDGSPGPPGTFYHRRSEHNVYFWNMFDQVLIRPSLLDRFNLEHLAIIDHTGEQKLLTGNGRPNRKVGSDHLPILFRLS
jgi:endonuclease/exonuclease/phosphatase (EEP) superfamily protein YafD